MSLMLLKYAACFLVGVAAGYILALLWDVIRKDKEELVALRKKRDELLAQKKAREADPQNYVMKATSPLASEKIGACGIGGCPNMRPHSHVMDLARRIREKK